MTANYSLSYPVPADGRLRLSHVGSELVGVAGFEPAASSSRTKRAAKLRYTPRDRVGSLADPRNQREHGCFRPAGEPDGGIRGGPEPGRDVQESTLAWPGARRMLVQPPRASRVESAVGDQRPQSGQADLAAVSVPGEQQVE